MGRLTHRTLPGATYFITTNTWQSTSVFQVQEVADIVVAKLWEYRQKGDYFLHEFVLMPSHLHLLITPSATTSLEKAIQLIKGGSSYEIHRVRGTKAEIWQRGFHESRDRDFADYKNKVDYIYFNPVAARLVARPQDWPHSSASRKYQLDPIPQGLKPVVDASANVGPEGPTPNTSSRSTNP